MGSLVITAEEGSKSGNQGVRKSPADPQNQGPPVKAFLYSSLKEKATMKKPFEQKKTLQFLVQLE